MNFHDLSLLAQKFELDLESEIFSQALTNAGYQKKHTPAHKYQIKTLRKPMPKIMKPKIIRGLKILAQQAQLFAENLERETK